MSTRTISLTTGLYAPPRSPVMVDVPAAAYLMVDGSGEPWRTLAWAEAVDAVHAVAAAVAHELGVAPGAAMPLESLFGPGNGDPSWTLLVALPDAATPDVVGRAVETVLRGGAPSRARDVRRGRLHEGWAAQVMQLGPGPDRRRALALLDAFVSRHGYAARGPRHEIFLDDPLDTAGELVRTVVRQPVVAVG